MSFKVAGEVSEVQAFLRSVNVKQIEDEVLKRASWGTNPVKDIIDILMEHAQQWSQ